MNHPAHVGGFLCENCGEMPKTFAPEAKLGFFYLFIYLFIT